MSHLKVKSDIAVVLKEDSEILDEVVVVGYGSTTKMKRWSHLFLLLRLKK